uniref:GST C-terminal domain-containing protein n=1 Tax=Arcella intermedia TaxID=1963864 RepID=A0A6B2LJS7_9EUKA
MNISGVVLADTAAINVFLGKRTGLWPKDHEDIQEEVLIDYASASEDLRIQRYNMLGFVVPVPHDVQAKFVVVLQDWLFYFERQLSSPRSLPYLLGERFTPVDCRVWDVLDQIGDLLSDYPDVYDSYKNVQIFRNSVQSRPNIAAYLKTRK